MRAISLVLIILALASLSLCGSFKQSLADAVFGKQVKKYEKYDFPWHFEKFKGLFESDIHMNLRGDPMIAEVRDLMEFFDNNGFTTMFVVQFMVEAKLIDPSLAIDEGSLMDAIDAISLFHDKNSPDDLPLFSFWPQLKLVKDNITSWYAEPVNLLKPVDEFGSFEAVVVKILDTLHMSKLADDIIEMMGPIFKMLTAFNIPPDADDSAVNWQMGSDLYAASEVFPDLYKKWSSTNKDFENLSARSVKYSYKPFADDVNYDLIDPRQYFVVRWFLESIPAGEKGSTMLPLTWSENLETNRKGFERKIAMPFNVNNVDVTVAANFLYSIVANAIRQPEEAEKWLIDGIAGLCNGSADYIDFIFQKDILHKRPDIALTYYPSTQFFFFAVARSLHILESHREKLPFAFLEDIHNKLAKTLRTLGTDSLFSYATYDGDYVYFDDFLGDADEDFDGELLIRGEDRIFSTGAAVNAFIDIWTIESGVSTDGSITYSWLPETPAYVKSCVRASIDWLEKETLSGKFKPRNCFFSGSAKGFSSLPMFYPFNYGKYLNGTDVPPDLPMDKFSDDIVIGVRGEIDEATYEKMLDEIHFGIMPTPREFHGYNSNSTDAFPFWSSEPLSYAVALLADTKYHAISE